jgi:hypothetical protein
MAIPPLNFKARAWRLRHARQVTRGALGAVGMSVFAAIRDRPDLL